MGYSFCSLSDAFDGQAGLGRRRVVLSTDDGFACNYHTIAPILKKHGIPMIMFLIGKCIDNRALAWNHVLQIVRFSTTPDRLSSLMPQLQQRYGIQRDGNTMANLFSVPMAQKDALADYLWQQLMPISQEEYLHLHQPFLSSEQIAELQSQGHEVASHSQSHPDFSRLSIDEMVDEILQSKESLSGFGPVRFFAFPYSRCPDVFLVPSLCETSGIDACLGGRYRVCDNSPGTQLWQRSKMEQSPSDVALELFVKPCIRSKLL